MSHFIEIRYPGVKKTYLVEESKIKNYCVSCNTYFKNGPAHYRDCGNYCTSCNSSAREMVRIEIKLADAYKKRNYKLIRELEEEKSKVLEKLPRRVDTSFAFNI
jgi:hypothetical protein